MCVHGEARKDRTRAAGKGLRVDTAEEQSSIPGWQMQSKSKIPGLDGHSSGKALGEPAF